MAPEKTLDMEKDELLDPVIGVDVEKDSNKEFSWDSILDDDDNNNNDECYNFSSSSLLAHVFLMSDHHFTTSSCFYFVHSTVCFTAMFLPTYVYHSLFNACISYMPLTCFYLLIYYMPCKHGLTVFKLICRSLSLVFNRCLYCFYYQLSQTLQDNTRLTIWHS